VSEQIFDTEGIFDDDDLYFFADLLRNAATPRRAARGLPDDFRVGLAASQEC
jgi:hypothetical protein